MSEPGTTEVSWELSDDVTTGTPDDQWELIQRSVVNPWVDPPVVTAEMEALAERIDGGGRELIQEIEYEPVRKAIAAAYGIPMRFLFGTDRG